MKAGKSSLEPETFSQCAQALEARLDALIAPQRRFGDADNARFAKRLRKHRPHLLRFLYVDRLEATNNRAERMLRPAVITRKTNGCNLVENGTVSHAILSSVLVTCRQHSIPILDYLVQLQRFGGSPPPLVSSDPLNSLHPLFRISNAKHVHTNNTSIEENTDGTIKSVTLTFDKGEDVTLAKTIYVLADTYPVFVR